MTAVLLDTHAWAWSIKGDDRLSRRAVNQIDAATRVVVSSVSFYESAQKVRAGEWAEMVDLVDHLPDLLLQQNGCEAELTGRLALVAASSHGIIAIRSIASSPRPRSPMIFLSSRRTEPSMPSGRPPAAGSGDRPMLPTAAPILPIRSP